MYGALGDGLASHPAVHCSLECTEIPVTVLGVDDAVELATGQHFGCALRVGGSVSCWGDNRDGAVGIGSLGASVLAPMEVVGLADAAEVTAGWTGVCARRETGELVCWGDNGFGTVGDGTTIDRRSPAAVVLP